MLNIQLWNYAVPGFEYDKSNYESTAFFLHGFAAIDSSCFNK